MQGSLTLAQTLVVLAFIMVSYYAVCQVNTNTVMADYFMLSDGYTVMLSDVYDNLQKMRKNQLLQLCTARSLVRFG